LTVRKSFIYGIPRKEYDGWKRSHVGVLDFRGGLGVSQHLRVGIGNDDPSENDDLSKDDLSNKGLLSPNFPYC
jgi:hypothetical protein